MTYSLAGSLWDEEGVLVADLDMGEVARRKFDFDVAGHYAHPDLFQLVVNERSDPPVAYQGEPDGEGE